MSNATQPATPAEVWTVESMDTEDYDSSWQVENVFATKDAAEQYAAQFIEPLMTRVLSSRVLTTVPARVINYRLRECLPTRPDSPFARFSHAHLWDTEVLSFEITQRDADEALTPSDTVEPVVRNVRDIDGHSLDIETFGTDKDAVREAFVAAVADAKATAQRNGLTIA